MTSWMNWSMDAVEAFLMAIYHHLPSADGVFPWILFTFGLVILAGPGVAAFIGAWRWGAKAGFAGLVLGYFGGLWLIVATFGQMSRCRPEYHCGPPPDVPWTEELIDFVTAVAGAYAASWPWHLLWIAFGVGCLCGGLTVRRRRLVGQPRIDGTQS